VLLLIDFASSLLLITTSRLAEVMAVTLHTNYGDIKVEIFCYTTPMASENFLGLCASGAYDGTLFHRNIKQFMIQGGDPTGTGKGK
jgi:peptidyl-prolyl cis-trans isomerase-like 3